MWIIQTGLTDRGVDSALLNTVQALLLAVYSGYHHAFVPRAFQRGNTGQGHIVTVKECPGYRLLALFQAGSGKSARAFLGSQSHQRTSPPGTSTSGYIFKVFRNP